MSKTLIFAILVTLAMTQSCPGFYGGDLLQSGKYAIINPYTDGSSFKYTAPVYFQIPSSGIQISVTTATIGDYNPLNDWGYNFFIQGEKNGKKNEVSFEVIIQSDRSWSSIQLGYLFSGRTDLTVGNFQQSIGQFKSISPGVYKASYLVPRKLPNLSEGEYQIAAFISGFGITDDVFDLSINERWYTHKTRTIEIVFHSSSKELLNIIFSYVIYPDVHPVFVFSYDSRPDGDGSYHISGPVSFSKDDKIQYDEWRIQNRFLDCAGPTCQSNCVRTEDCIASFGNVWEGRCIYCAPGVVFERGVCARKCGANQFYFNRVCICARGYERKGIDCVKVNQCGQNQKQVNGKCVCNAGYALWQEVCRKCPSNAKSSADGQTCVCDNDYVFNAKDNTCDRRCDISQNWIDSRCVCKSGYISYKQACRQCPSGSIPNSEKTTCVCADKSKVYIYDSNKCDSCPSGFVPNADRSDCVCPSGTKLTEGACVKECKAGEKLVKGECVPDCGINEKVVEGKCQCIPGYIDLGGLCVNQCGINEQWSVNKCVCAPGHAKYNGVCRKCPETTKPNADQTWCLCQKANQIFNPTKSVCQSCPANSSPNAKGDECLCNPGFTDKSGACIKESVCPPNSEWDDKTFTCVCTRSGENLIDGKCQTCPPNEGFNGKSCVCRTGFFRIDGVCRTCDPRSTYIRGDCVCNNGFYGDRDLCKPCHASCGKCTGPQANQCTACADISLVLKDGFCTSDGPCPIGSYLNGNSCKNCLPFCQDCDSETNCKKCAVGFEKISIPFGGQEIVYCEQICGDGRRFEQACDDGNKKKGDGCSDTCEVESGWTCVGGTSIRKDSCSEFIPNRTILESRGIVNLGGRVVQSVRASYLPACITENQCASCFKALKVSVIESLVPVSVVVNYVPESKYQFFVEYKFDGLFVSSAFKVAIRLNRDFDSCFSADDFNQVLELTIDPSVFICNDKTYPLEFDANGVPVIRISDECRKTYLN